MLTHAHARAAAKQLNNALLVATRGAREGLWLEQRGHRVRSSLVIFLSLHNPVARAARALAPRAGRYTASRAAQEGLYWFSEKHGVRKHLVR